MKSVQSFKVLLGTVMSGLLMSCSAGYQTSPSVFDGTNSGLTDDGSLGNIAPGIPAIEDNDSANGGVPSPAAPEVTIPEGTTVNPNDPGAQSCGAPGTGPRAAGSISINGGKASTKDMQVKLDLGFNEVTMMKISSNADCSCGTWEPFSATKVWTLGKTNTMNIISVQFQDYDGISSQCVSASVLHDSEAPLIALSADPNNQYYPDTTLNYDLIIKDNGVGVANAVCKLDSVTVACGNSISFSNLPVGKHTLSVTATDSLNQTAQQSVNIDIAARLQHISQSKSITADNKVDILFIVDNSGSMSYEQKNMAQRTSTFMKYLANLDYQIAVTTTDPGSKAVGGDGALLPVNSSGTNQYIITPAMGMTEGQNMLSNTLQRKETGSSSEQGIYATYRVVERAIAQQSPQKGFFRSDAAFAAIVISDENESATNAKNLPQNLIDFVARSFPAKKFNFHSIITRPGDTACLNGEGESYGKTYDQLSRLLGYGTVGGSLIGSVCASDYGEQMAGLGNSVVQMIRTIDLNCAPAGNATSSVSVKKDGVSYNDLYEVQGSKIIFQNNLPAGNYTLDYYCP